MILFFDHCRNLIRTLPMMQHDDDPEDLDTDGKDHAVADIRYACLSRAFRATAAKVRDKNPFSPPPTSSS